MMKADPSTRRARSVVLLVILTIALPSILLTVMGAAAIGNEEVAARRRIERAYQPVLWDLAKKFHDDVDLIVAKSAKPLEQLAGLPPNWDEPLIDEADLRAMALAQVEGRGDNVRVHVRAPRIDHEKIRRMARRAQLIARRHAEHALNGDDEEEDEDAADQRELVAFIESQPVATNYFVIAPDGEVLIPDAEGGEKVTAALPPSFYDQGKSCEEKAMTCIQRYAKAKSTDELMDECNSYAKSAAAAAGLALDALFVERSRNNDRFIEEANTLARMLSNPLKHEPAYLVEYLARRTARQLGHIPGIKAERARYLFTTIAERPALLRHLTGLSHPRDSSPQVAAYGVDDWRRVIVSRNVDGYTVGFELVPTQFEPIIDASLAARAPNEPVAARIETIQLPQHMRKMSRAEMEEYDKKTATWILLKRTDLAWKMVMLMTDEGALLGLMRSRSTLYFWSLILMAGALLVGIGYTVRSVIREANLARLKTDFVSSVSHDLRTPLTSIRMFTETLLLNRASSEEEAREFLRVIADETERLSRLTERILDFSRMEAGRKAYHFSPLDIRDLIQRSLLACRPMIEEAGFEVTVDADHDLPAINADRDAMIEVLINLVSNAIKYSPEEKKITIRATREGDRVAISVSDRGIGIPKSEHKKIFEKFYRVECRRTCEVGGSGIGLSLVDHIISAHQGAVDVASRPGEGSTFTVRLGAAGVS